MAGMQSGGDPEHVGEGAMRWDKCKCGWRMHWDPHGKDTRTVTCPKCQTVYRIEADDQLVYWLEEKIPEPTRHVTRAR